LREELTSLCDPGGVVTRWFVFQGWRSFLAQPLAKGLNPCRDAPNQIRVMGVGSFREPLDDSREQEGGETPAALAVGTTALHTPSGTSVL
jgi:hypothetical protein